MGGFLKFNTVYKILSNKAGPGGGDEVLFACGFFAFSIPQFPQAVRVFQSPALLNAPGTTGGKGDTSASDYKRMHKK